MKDQWILTPYFLDQHLPGLAFLQEPGWILNQLELPKAATQQRMSALHQPLARQVAQALKGGERPVSLAGDCCTSIGFLAGMQAAGLDPFLIWLDAHGDFHTWGTTQSGFLGGMPLAMLTGRGEQQMAEAVGLRPIADSSVLLCDGRDLDPGEKEAVAGSGLVHQNDLGQALESIPADRPLWVHFDTDVLRPEDAPAMNYLAPGGPSVPEMEIFFASLNRSQRVYGLSISSWNPEMKGARETEKVCLDLIRVLLD